jgi:hypothetical protein
VYDVGLLGQTLSFWQDMTSGCLGPIVYYSVPLVFVVFALFFTPKVFVVYLIPSFTNSYILLKLGEITNTRLARDL